MLDNTLAGHVATAVVNKGADIVKGVANGAVNAAGAVAGVASNAYHSLPLKKDSEKQLNEIGRKPIKEKKPKKENSDTPKNNGGSGNGGANDGGASPSGYTPNFTLVDQDGTVREANYQPNFVLIDKDEDKKGDNKSNEKNGTTEEKKNDKK